MAVERLDDGTYQSGDMNFPTSEQAFAYDKIRSEGVQRTHRPLPGPPSPPPEPEKTGMSLWWLVILIPGAIFILFLIIGAMAGPPDEKSQARSAISLCWDEQKRKSLDPAMQRFIAGACEKMENDFRAKYKVNP